MPDSTSPKKVKKQSEKDSVSKSNQNLHAPARQLEWGDKMGVLEWLKKDGERHFRKSIACILDMRLTRA